MLRLALLCIVLGLQFGCSDTHLPTEDDPGDPPGTPAIASVSVTGPVGSLAVGETAQLSAVARDAEGKVMSDASVVWSSSDDDVVSVTSGGLAKALSPGEATISAAAGDKSGGVAIRVEAPLPPFERGTIAYVRDDALRLIEPDGSGDRLLWALPDPTYRITGVSWRPDGSEIAFASNHEMAVSFFERDIYAIRPDGERLRKLTNAPAHEDLGALPRGTVTVTVGNASFEGGPFFVYLMGAEEPKSVIVNPGGSATVTFTNVADLGEGVQQPAVVVSGIYRWWDAAVGADVKAGATVNAGRISITANPVEHFGADVPFWRGDGEAVGFIGSPTCMLQRVPADPPLGPTYEPLVDPGVWGSICAVDWAPDPDLADPLLLADMSDYTLAGETHIHRVPEGSDRRTSPVITFSDYVRVFDLRWLPDGSGFLVARQDGLLDEDVNLYAFSFGTGELSQLTDFTGEFVRSFSVSPDGESIVFERVTGGSIYDLATLPSDLWVIGRDGTNPRLLVRGGRLPAW